MRTHARWTNKEKKCGRERDVRPKFGSPTRGLSQGQQLEPPSGLLRTAWAASSASKFLRHSNAPEVRQQISLATPRPDWADPEGPYIVRRKKKSARQQDAIKLYIFMFILSKKKAPHPLDKKRRILAVTWELTGMSQTGKSGGRPSVNGNQTVREN